MYYLGKITAVSQLRTVDTVNGKMNFLTFVVERRNATTTATKSGLQLQCRGPLAVFLDNWWNDPARQPLNMVEVKFEPVMRDIRLQDGTTKTIFENIAEDVNWVI